MTMLRPLIDIQRDIDALYKQGHRAMCVPDVGLYCGESVTEGLRRMETLNAYARRLGITLFLRNERNGDTRVHPITPAATS